MRYAEMSVTSNWLARSLLGRRFFAHWSLHVEASSPVISSSRRPTERAADLSDKQTSLWAQSERESSKKGEEREGMKEGIRQRIGPTFD